MDGSRAQANITTAMDAADAPDQQAAEPQAVARMGQLTVVSKDDSVPSVVRTRGFISVNRGRQRRTPPPPPPMPVLADAVTNGANGANGAITQTSTEVPEAGNATTNSGSAKAQRRKRAQERKQLAAAENGADGGAPGDSDNADGGVLLNGGSVGAAAAAPVLVSSNSAAGDSVSGAANGPGKKKNMATIRTAKRAEWRTTEIERKLQQQEKKAKEQKQQPAQADQPKRKAKYNKKGKQQQQQQQNAGQAATTATAMAEATTELAAGKGNEGIGGGGGSGPAVAEDGLPAFFGRARFDGLQRPQNHQQQQRQTSPADSPRPRARSPVRTPSAESGGVPEPSAAYLAAAARPLAAALPGAQPQPLLVVIDLNGTLLFRPSRHRQPKRFVPRPHAAAFLRHCLDQFAVVIWSSARPENVDALWRELLATGQEHPLPPPPPPAAVWGRDHFGLSPTDYRLRVQCYKRLSTVWGNASVAAAYPVGAGGDNGNGNNNHGQGWSQANTVLIDDSLEKARSEPHNLIAIPEYLGAGSEDPPVLPLVRDYLQILRFQQNVSAYMRQHPFRVPDRGGQGP